MASNPKPGSLVPSFGALNAGAEKTSPQAVRRAAGFLMRLARAVHTCGMPAHRLELALRQVGQRLGVEGQSMVTPTSIVASVGPPDAAQTFLVGCDPAGAARLLAPGES